MRSFQDGVEKLLWPERRPGFGSVYRTTEQSWLVLDTRYLPDPAAGALRLKGVIEPSADGLRLGPIPKGTPINLLANIHAELTFDPRRLIQLVDVLFETKYALREMRQGAAQHRQNGRSAAQRSGRIIPTIVFHANRDSTVHPSNGDQVIAQSGAAAGLRSEVQRGQVAGGYAFSCTRYIDADGKAMLEQWLVHGAGHAWSGGSLARELWPQPGGPHGKAACLGDGRRQRAHVEILQRVKR